jgi:hypothetical protein
LICPSFLGTESDDLEGLEWISQVFFEDLNFHPREEGWILNRMTAYRKNEGELKDWKETEVERNWTGT